MSEAGMVCPPCEKAFYFIVLLQHKFNSAPTAFRRIAFAEEITGRFTYCRILCGYTERPEQV